MWTRVRLLLAGRPESSRLLGAGMVVMLLLGSAGFVAGRGDSALHVLVRAGAAWLPTTQRGSVSLVDGQSGRSSVELLLGGASGHYLIVSQHGNQVLVLDTRTNRLIRINVAQLTLGAAVSTAAGSVVVAGLAATYLVNYRAGTVQRIDPVTLAPIGPQVHMPGRLGTTAVVDGNGTLWVPVLSNGTVVPVTSAGAGHPVPVGTGGADLVLTTAAGALIAVDRSAHTITTLGTTGTHDVITLPASAAAGGSQALLVPASGQGGTLPLVNRSGAPSLVIVDLGTGTTRDVPLGSEVTGHALGQPVQSGRQVFIPDYTTGSVLVYDASADALAATIPVTGHPGTFESEVIDGIAYFNDPDGSNAVAVTPDGQVHEVVKTGPGVPTARHGQPPGRAPVPVPASQAPPAPAPAPAPPARSRPHGPPSWPPAPPRQPGTPTSSQPSPPASSPPPSSPPASAPVPSSAPPAVPAPPPLAPQNPQATPGAGFVDVTWQPPAGGGPVARYAVSVSPGGGSQSPTGATSVRVTGLACGTSYSFTVSAVGASGQQVAAAPVAAQPCTPPGAPQGLSAAVSQHQIQLSWSAPAASGGGPVTYTVSWGGGSHTGVTGTSDTITGLANFQTYTVTVTAVSPGGTGGSASAPVSVSPGSTWGYNITRDWKYTLNVRAAPDTGSASISAFPAGGGQPVQVICQVGGGSYRDPSGSPAGNIWDKLASGGYVADGYVTTPNSLANTVSPPIWACS